MTRVVVPGIAVLRAGAQIPSVWRVTNLSAGGVALLGDVALVPGRLSLALHVAGFPTLELSAKVLRRQLKTRGGQCAVEFVDLSERQQQALLEITTADHAPSLAMGAMRRVLIVGLDEARARTLSTELRSLGFVVRRETSPGQAAAWLQKESTEVVLVDEGVIDADRWSLLQFARDVAPEVRRFVVANDVRGFRLYYAMKAGLVDGLIGETLPEGALAQRLLGDAGLQSRTPRRSVKAPRARRTAVTARR